MATTRVMIIRHAEKPTDSIGGVAPDGRADPESLSPRGWQRAGALAPYFGGRSPYPDAASLVPDVVLAAGVGPGSKSRRPMQTVTPLVEFLRETRHTPFVTRHLKGDCHGVVAEAISRGGTALICWQHKEILDLVRRLSPDLTLPRKWPGDRFDVTWILDRHDGGWRLSQRPQAVLAGDRTDVIA